MTGSSCWPSGGGCWYKAKYEMRDAATQDRRRNERAKLLIFREIAKRRRWRHAKFYLAVKGLKMSIQSYKIVR